MYWNLPYRCRTYVPLLCEARATGNRTDVRWMELADEAREGLSFRSDKVFQFSVIPFTDSNVDQATHINKLERTGIINVHLDAEQSGVGTATCGPGYCRHIVFRWRSIRLSL